MSFGGRKVHISEEAVKDRQGWQQNSGNTTGNTTGNAPIYTLGIPRKELAIDQCCPVSDQLRMRP